MLCQTRDCLFGCSIGWIDGSGTKKFSKSRCCLAVFFQLIATFDVLRGGKQSSSFTRGFVPEISWFLEHGFPIGIEGRFIVLASFGSLTLLVKGSRGFAGIEPI